MSQQSIREKRISRWYFGGLASAGAACFTHPLDLLKVTLQTQQEVKLSMFQLTGNIVRKQGVLAFYNGISASLLRQLTYSTTRFGIYEVGKQSMGNDAGFFAKIMLAGSAGAAGGLIGTPADMVNVRMQNDVKLPAELKRKCVTILFFSLFLYRSAIRLLLKLYTRFFSATKMPLMGCLEFDVKRDLLGFFRARPPQRGEDF